MGDTHKIGKLGNGLLEPGQPQRDAGKGQVFPALHLGERADIAHNAVEVVLAAHQHKGSRIRGIEGDAQLIEAGVAQLSSLLGGEDGAVGVEQHVGATRLEIAHHAGQLFDQHGLAHAMQNNASDVWHLVDDAGEQLPAHVGLGLEIGIGARTSGAEQVAAVGGFQIQAHRLAGGRRSDGVVDGIVVAAWVNQRRASGYGAHDVTFANAWRLPPLLHKSYERAANVAKVNAAKRVPYPGVMAPSCT